MKVYICCSLVCLIVFASAGATLREVSIPDELSSLIKTLEPAENLGTSGNGLFLLIPSGFNLTDIFNANSDFSLFKLNTDVLLPDGINIRTKRATTAQTKQALEAARTSRKISLFRNLFNKPKHSPLYLVNGTVCRFVSTGPVCTTISTNGLPGKLTARFPPQLERITFSSE